MRAKKHAERRTTPPRRSVSNACEDAKMVDIWLRCKDIVAGRLKKSNAPNPSPIVNRLGSYWLGSCWRKMRRFNALAFTKLKPCAAGSIWQGRARRRKAYFYKKTPEQSLLCSGVVRAWGHEPQRLAAREPKGDVTSVKDFQSPPYHKGRASFPTLQKIFRLWPAEHLLNHSTLCRKSIAWL